MHKLFLSFAAIGLVACTPGAPAPLTASLQSDPPGAGYELGGAIDRVDYDEATGQLRIEGWHMFTPRTHEQDLKVYANNAVSIESVTSRERADVVSAIGDADLVNSGFILTLKTDPSIPLERICVSMTDRHYGARVLIAQPGNRAPCFGAG